MKYGENRNFDKILGNFEDHENLELPDEATIRTEGLGSIVAPSLIDNNPSAEGKDSNYPYKYTERCINGCLPTEVEASMIRFIALLH